MRKYVVCNSWLTTYAGTQGVDRPGRAKHPPRDTRAWRALGAPHKARATAPKTPGARRGGWGVMGAHPIRPPSQVKMERTRVEEGFIGQPV
jgi:hypothetical protein